MSFNIPPEHSPTVLAGGLEEASGPHPTTPGKASTSHRTMSPAQENMLLDPGSMCTAPESVYMDLGSVYMDPESLFLAPETGVTAPGSRFLDQENEYLVQERIFTDPIHPTLFPARDL